MKKRNKAKMQKSLYHTIKERQPIGSWPRIKIKWDYTKNGQKYCRFDEECEIRFALVSIGELSRVLRDFPIYKKVWNNITDDKVVSVYEKWSSGCGLSPPSAYILESKQICLSDGNHRLKVALALGCSKIPFAIKRSDLHKFQELFEKIEMVIDETAYKYENAYLYGSKEKLDGLINNRSGIRFTDIHHYAKLENETIRDNEANKEFKFDHFGISSLECGSIRIPGKAFERIKLGIPTRRCHCLCLSKDKNSANLFERFKADVCIEIDVSYLVRVIEDGICLKGAVVEAKEIKYVDKNPLNIDFNPQSIVFVKNIQYEIENEFRIAIFYPFDENTVVNNDVYMFGEHNHIELRVAHKGEKPPYILDVYQKIA